MADDYDYNQESIFAEYDGFIVKVSEKAIGLGKKPYRAGQPKPKIDVWIPKSQLGYVTYPEGDSKKLKEGSRIECVQIPRWLAKEKGLGESDD